MNPYPFRPKQSLGQNFLTDLNIVRKIVRALAPTPDDTILEIGPGFGVLTAHLLPEAKQVIAVEIDKYLVEKLQARFRHDKNLKLISGDFRKLELCGLAEVPVRVVGNIPYHITSPVIFKVFDNPQTVVDMQLMIQREVAERIVAEPRTKAYGVLSVVSQLYSEPRILFHVSRNVFNPKPEVESSVVHWDLRKAPEFEIADEAFLRALVRGSFNQRRKMLRRSLRQLDISEQTLARLDFDLQKRPEELTVADFVELSNQIVSHGNL